MAESESDLAKAVNDPGDREISLSNSDQSETNPPGEGQNSIIVKAKKEKTLTRSVSFSSYTKVREIKNKAVGSQRDEEAGEQLHQEKMGKNVFEGVITETEIVKPMKVSKKGERNRSEERWAEKTSKAVKKKGEMIEVTSKTAVRKNGQNDEKGKRKTGKKKKRDKKEPARSKVRKPTRRDNSKLGSPLSPSSGPTITSSKVSMWTKQTADHDLKPASERHLSGRHSAGMLQLGAESSEETWECTPSALIPEELLPPVDLFPKSDDSSDSADDEEEYVECRPSTAPTLASAGSNRAQQLLQASQTSSKPLSALPTGRLPSLESAPAAQDSAEREVKDDQEDDKKPVTLKGVVGKMKLNFKAFGTSQDSQKVLPVVHGLTNSRYVGLLYSMPVLQRAHSVSVFCVAMRSSDVFNLFFSASMSTMQPLTGFTVLVSVRWAWPGLSSSFAAGHRTNRASHSLSASSFRVVTSPIATCSTWCASSCRSWRAEER